MAIALHLALFEHSDVCKFKAIVVIYMSWITITVIGHVAMKCLPIRLQSIRLVFANRRC